MVDGNGDEVYSETHNTSTNESGLIDLTLGTGEGNDNANLDDIDWGSDFFTLLTEVNVDEHTFNTSDEINPVPLASRVPCTREVVLSE